MPNTKKSLPQKCINSLVPHKLSHDRLFCFYFLGAYGSLPDAAIWWCLLRTGGGGVLTSHHFTFRNCPNVAVPILAFTDDLLICYAKSKPISIVNSSRWESIRACMCGSKRRALIHVSTCITICETLITYTQSDCRTLCHSFCVVGDFGYIHCSKCPNSVLNVITPSQVCW